MGRTMTAIYGFCAVVGGVLALVMVLGGGDSDLDLDTDLDADLEVPTDVDSVSEGAGSLLGSLLSFRTVVFSVAFFGLTGLLLPLAGAGDVSAFLAAVAVGGVAGFTNDRLLRYLRVSESDSAILAGDIAGSIARVQLPIDDSTKGSVIVERHGRTLRLVAEPFKPAHRAFGTDDEVVVVEVRDGIARIAPMELLE